MQALDHKAFYDLLEDLYLIIYLFDHKEFLSHFLRIKYFLGQKTEVYNLWELTILYVYFY